MRRAISRMRAARISANVFKITDSATLITTIVLDKQVYRGARNALQLRVTKRGRILIDFC